MTKPAPHRPSTHWLTFGVANTAIIAVVSLGVWYLFADPQLSPFDLYPLPFNAALFWGLLLVVWWGFNTEFWGLDRLRQPIRGLVILIATIAFAVLVTYALGNGLGVFYPDLAASRADGLGYFTGALFVLFGFSTWALVVLNWTHWPWTDLGLKQPFIGICEIGVLLIPTALLYLVLGIPPVSSTVREGSALLEVNTLLGWYYGIIVSILLTGLTLDNWPWRLAGNRAMVALASVLGNVVLGTSIYFVLLRVCKLLIGSETVAELGPVINQFPAQLGVCWVAWIILWAMVFGNRPTGLPATWNLLDRTAITFALAVITFLAYYYLLAGPVLHEPAVAGALHGNALGFMDLFVLVALLYIVGFDSYGLRKPVEHSIDTDAGTTATV